MGVQAFYMMCIVLGLCHQVQTQAPTCDPNDLRALQDFMAGLLSTISGWEHNSSSDCCKWAGVACNSSPSPGSNNSIHVGRVVKLELSNMRLYGKLSESLGSLDQLRTLNLSHNFLESSIPISLFNLSSLQVLDLSFNDFYGPVPEVVNLSSIQILDMSHNKLNGSLPNQICDGGSSELKILKLESNLFSGDLPSGLENCASLDHLSVRMNQLTGMSAGVFRLQNLSELIISDNELSGQLSNGIGSKVWYHWLSKSKQLQLLDLSWNCMVGTLPGWLGDFKSLFYLDLSNNSFTGEIPKNITRLRSLIDKVISLEEPSQDFPFFIKRTPSERGLQYNQVWSLPPTLNLSCNYLTGQICPEFGNLRKLHVLSLRFNYLSGPIPSTLSEMGSLETLDLSHNKLSGTIPSSLVKLSFLSKFDVSWNQLHGMIPKEGQFSTFPNSSFEGNNLCGDQANSCLKIENRSNEPLDESRGNTGFDDGIVVATAVGMAFGLVFGVALFQVTSRNSLHFKRLWIRLNLPT